MSQADDPYKERDAAIQKELDASGAAFRRNLLSHPNPKEVKKLVEEHAEFDFGRHYAGKMEALDYDSKEYEERCTYSGESLSRFQKKESQTDPYISVAAARGDGKPGDIPFAQWGLKDQAEYLLTVILGVLVLGASSATAFSAIMSQGIPTFLEEPWLAAFLSILLPASSMALHFLADLLDDDRSRRLYIQTIFKMTGVSLAAWIGIFALNFAIGSSTVDLESLGKTDYIAILFTALQMSTEVLCGASLFLKSGFVHARYSGSTHLRNSESLMLGTVIHDRRVPHDEDRKLRNAVRGRLVQLQAMREVHKQNQVALYMSTKSRFAEFLP